MIIQKNGEYEFHETACTKSKMLKHIKINRDSDTKYYTLSITTMSTVLRCDADRHEFGIYTFPKGKDWRTAGDESLYGYTNAFCLGKNDKNEHTYSAENAKQTKNLEEQ